MKALKVSRKAAKLNTKFAMYFLRFLCVFARDNLY